VTFRECDAEQVCRLLEQAVDVELQKKVDLKPNELVNLKYKEGLLPTDYSLSCGVETWGERTTARVGLSGFNVLSSLLPQRCEGAEKRILGLVTEAVLRQSEAGVVDASDSLYKRLGPIPGGEEENVSAVTLYGVTQDEVVTCLGEGATSYIGLGFSWYGYPDKKTPSGVTVTCTDSMIPFCADYYIFKVETSPVLGGVQVSVSGECHIRKLFSNNYDGPLGKARRNRSLRSVVIYLLDRLHHASLTEPVSQ